MSSNLEKPSTPVNSTHRERTKRRHIQLHDKDNIVVCLSPTQAGESISVQEGIVIRAAEAIPAGHKLAISAIPKGEFVYKFGWPIGKATQDISAGEHVHSQNLMTDHKIDMQAIATDIPAPFPPLEHTFRGYRRCSGAVGTRNYIAVISNVNCSASVARMVAKHFDDRILEDFTNVDGVISFRHEAGCAMAWDGNRHRMLNDVLAGIARHPNIGGYLLVGLGCEQGSLDHLISSKKLHQIAPIHSGSNSSNNAGNGSSGNEPLIPVLSIQSSGGTRKTVEQGIQIVREMLPAVNEFRREEVSASHLTLALECGGSDGYSGITANPALGVASDLLVASGGTAILSETAEIYGAEHLLTRRARSREVAEKLLERIEWWRWYCGNYGEEFDSNPSVGNKQGGLTTITEKSLGAVSKGGVAALEAVYEYAQPVHHKGFVVMDTPGYDPASVTGMVAGGANLVAFTTGRGSCFGFKPAPSFKIASNSDLYHRMPEDMDFNAGQVLEGKSLEEVGHELFLRLLETASGKPTCSEQLGIGDEEFVPWLVGPVL